MVRHFPWGKAFLLLVFAGVFFVCGQAIASAEDALNGLAYFLRGISLILLLPLFGLSVTEISVSGETGLLDISKRMWWWPSKKHETCSPKEVQRILLRDNRRGWDKMEVGIDYIGSRHNWELVAESLNDEILLLPQGCASYLGGRRMGSKLAVMLGVPFVIEDRDIPIS